VTALALTFAHTLGEFGVVLMVGGNIPGETRTAAIAIYDRVQAFDNAAAGAMSAVLLGLSFLAIGLVFMLGQGRQPRA
jgi:molybdate transport system permease protein